MSVNSTHPEYEENLTAWLRARDVIAGEDAIKCGGEKYLPRLEAQTDEEYGAYRDRASFFNATARTADGYLGLLFRRPPFIKVAGKAGGGGQRAEGTGQKKEIRGQRSEVNSQSGDGGTARRETRPTGRSGEGLSGLGRAMTQFINDADMLGTSMANYARNVAREVIGVGRVGTLIDWEAQSENRVYLSLYTAENILNWRTERVHGRNVLTMLVLAEKAETLKAEKDEFEQGFEEQIRVLKLAEGGGQCEVEIWRPKKVEGRSLRAEGGKREWELVETRVPLRLGKPLPLIPFVFHGASNDMPEIGKLPLSDVIAVNLDHYRLHADYRHGMHFTALPTAWVSGFDKSATLRIGSSTAWVTDTPGATAGFLEYTGQGLTTFERAMDRDERLMAVLGARLLETQKRVGETADAIELRQSGENSILGALAGSVSMSLTHVLRWAHWWNSTESMPDDVTHEQALMELNTDFSTKGLAANEIAAVVQAWQNGALSRDSMLDLFRRGEVLPEGRTNEEEMRLIEKWKPLATDEHRTAQMQEGKTAGKVLTAENAKSTEKKTPMNKD
jgi:hypothetical protein